jgi:hypothetical protein
MIGILMTSNWRVALLIGLAEGAGDRPLDNGEILTVLAGAQHDGAARIALAISATNTSYDTDRRRSAEGRGTKITIQA